MNNNYDEIDNLLFKYFEKDQEVPKIVIDGINSAIKTKKKNYKLLEFIRKIIITILSIITFTGGIVFALNYKNIVSPDIKNHFGPNSSDGVDIAVNNGYFCEVNTEYQNSNGIQVKIASMLIDDYNFDMNFNIIIDDKYDIENINIYDLKIVDETQKIVFNSPIPEFETEEMRYEIYRGGYSLLSKKIAENQFNLNLSATGNSEPFPKSKYLKITFSKILLQKYIDGNFVDEEYYGDWSFEIEVPEMFYNREKIKYKAVSCNDRGINLDGIEACVYNTAFKLYIPEIKSNKIDFKYFGLDKFEKEDFSKREAIKDEYVENSKGELFGPSARSDGDGGWSIPKGEKKLLNFSSTFNLTKFYATDEITVHMYTNKNKEIIINLEKE